MKKFRQILLVSLAIMMVFTFFGCGNSQAPAPEATATPAPTVAPVALTISAAASLKDAMGEIKQLYSSDKPNVTLTINFGASGSLQQQIEQGAPADIFMSAATKQMDALKQKGLLIDDTVKNLLVNEVVLVTPKDSVLVKSFNDLTNDKVKKIAVGEPKSVPAGQYGEEVLTNLKIMDKVKAKEIYAKDVKEVLAWVETGNVDAGIVYSTDAKVSTKVQIAANAPENSHKAIIYPAAVIKSSKNADAAKDFLNYLSGDKAKAVFEKYGFIVSK